MRARTLLFWWFAFSCAFDSGCFRLAIAQTSRLELRLDLGRAIRAVRVYVRRRVDLVQKPIEFPAVMHARVGHLVATDQFVLGIRVHMVLVAGEAPCFLVQRASLSFCRFGRSKPAR
jgi:hypothetical protein